MRGLVSQQETARVQESADNYEHRDQCHWQMSKLSVSVELLEYYSILLVPLQDEGVPQGSAPSEDKDPLSRLSPK